MIPVDTYSTVHRDHRTFGAGEVRRTFSTAPRFSNQVIATIVTQAYQRYRAGGLVIGPGTGTSDEIQALLSHGESVNTEEETARIIALGQGDYDAGRAKVTELLKSRRAAQQAMLNQYDILIKEAIMSARGAAGASREAILQAIQGKYGFAPSAEDLDTVLGQDEDFVETSGGIWNYLPWWLGGTQVSKKPPVRAPVARKWQTTGRSQGRQRKPGSRQVRDSSARDIPTNPIRSGSRSIQAADACASPHSRRHHSSF